MQDLRLSLIIIQNAAFENTTYVFTTSRTPAIAIPEFTASGEKNLVKVLFKQFEFDGVERKKQ